MMTAAEIFALVRSGEISATVTRETKAFIFYRVDFRGSPETIRVHRSQAL